MRGCLPRAAGEASCGPGRGWELLGGVIYRVPPAKNVACIAAVPFSEKTDLLSELQLANPFHSLFRKLWKKAALQIIIIADFR